MLVAKTSPYSQSYSFPRLVRQHSVGPAFRANRPPRSGVDTSTTCSASTASTTAGTGRTDHSLYCRPTRTRPRLHPPPINHAESNDATSSAASSTSTNWPHERRAQPCARVFEPHGGRCGPTLLNGLNLFDDLNRWVHEHVRGIKFALFTSTVTYACIEVGRAGFGAGALAGLWTGPVDPVVAVGTALAGCAIGAYADIKFHQALYPDD